MPRTVTYLLSAVLLLALLSCAQNQPLRWFEITHYQQSPRMNLAEAQERMDLRLREIHWDNYRQVTKPAYAEAYGENHDVAFSYYVSPDGVPAYVWVDLFEGFVNAIPLSCCGDKPAAIAAYHDSSTISARLKELAPERRLIGARMMCSGPLVICDFLGLEANRTFWRCFDHDTGEEWVLLKNGRLARADSLRADYFHYWERVIMLDRRE
ncbi:MAG: hypothetical protein ABIJ61_09370 [bacterium]